MTWLVSLRHQVRHAMSRLGRPLFDRACLCFPRLWFRPKRGAGEPLADRLCIMGADIAPFRLAPKYVCRQRLPTSDQTMVAISWKLSLGLLGKSFSRSP